MEALLWYFVGISELLIVLVCIDLEIGYWRGHGD
jgi:hypothetical protein